MHRIRTRAVNLPVSTHRLLRQHPAPCLTRLTVTRYYSTQRSMMDAETFSTSLATTRSRSPSAVVAEPAVKKARLASPESIGKEAQDDSATGVTEVSQNHGVDMPVDALDASGVPAATAAGASGSNEGTKESKPRKQKKNKRPPPPEPCSPEDVVAHDVAAVLGEDAMKAAVAAGAEWDAPFSFKDEVVLEVKALSSHGEGIAVCPSASKPWVVFVPFTLPGETVRARIYRNSRMHSFADLIAVETPNAEMRDDNLVRCKYFGKCAGCQYQMLSYDTQLDLKRNVIVKAYANFSNISAEALPPILPTHGSPLQYDYRTKITPHFEAPPKRFLKPDAERPPEGEQPSWLKIGFNQVGTRHAMDIEECPIATPVINNALKPVREGIIKKIFTYKKGVSLLFRDSLEVSTPPPTSPIAGTEPVASTEHHVCVTDHRATVRERVGDMLFEFQGGSFFQNNNSVLIPLVDYVRTAIFGPQDTATSISTPPTHLVDAYCGSGLFAITLAPHFSKVAGIEISSEAIRSATHNATLNSTRIPASTELSFRAGDAADIFAVVGDFPPERTAVLIDPPRKGTDARFIEQLIALGPQTIVYVSCNVHTQARDVGMMLRMGKEKGVNYIFESVRGFDLFPQTAHVESVAILRKVSAEPTA